MKRIIAFILMLSLSVLLMFGCSETDVDSVDTNVADASKPDTESLSQLMTDPNNPVAYIKIKNDGYMVVELYYDKAPNTVRNFISLAESGYYNGLTFHRVIPGFMIQGGDPNGNGSGGPGYNIFGEFPNNGFDNDLKHIRGVISMARRGNPYDPEPYYNTAGSQFFIMVEDYPSLDGDYAAFGYCIYGMDVADRIVAVQTDSNDKPLTDVVIESITVETHGVAYDEPETIS